MLEQIVTRTAGLLVGAMLLCSCAHFSQSGRQQLAYAKYVKKQSHNRVRQQTKFKKVRVPAAPPLSDPKINADTGGPQSVTSGQSQEQQ